MLFAFQSYFTQLPSPLSVVMGFICNIVTFVTIYIPYFPPYPSWFCCFHTIKFTLSCLQFCMESYAHHYSSLQNSFIILQNNSYPFTDNLSSHSQLLATTDRFSSLYFCLFKSIFKDYHVKPNHTTHNYCLL